MYLMFMMSKKLCFITTIESTQESFIIPAAYLFKKRGYDISLICSMSDSFVEKYGKDFKCINVQMHRGISFGDILTKPFEFYRIFKREKFDYVQYATTNASFYAGLPAKLLGIKTRVYCSWGLLYVGYVGLKRTIFRYVEKLLCATATHITVASYKNMDVAVDDGVMPRKKCSVIGDGGTIGVDLNQFDYGKREALKTEVLMEYPALAGKTVFGYVGRIETDKGVNELLMAFRKTNNPNFALLLIGPFDELRCNLDKETIAWAKTCPNVIFHGFSREVPKYMSAMDILVHPTYREGFSMVIQQAMAMGCAIITTNVPGPSEVIEENISGLLVPDHSVDGLSDAMTRLGNSKDLQMQFASAGLERVKEKFERSRMLELTLKNRIEMMNGEI